VRRELHEPSPTTDGALAASAMRLLRALLEQQLCPPPRPDGAASTPRERRLPSCTGNGCCWCCRCTHLLPYPPAYCAPTTPLPALPTPGILLDDTQRTILLESLAIFSLVWSVGCTTDGEGRGRFDAFFRAVTSGSAPAGYEELFPGGRPPKLAAAMMPASAQAQGERWRRHLPACLPLLPLLLPLPCRPVPSMPLRPAQAGSPAPPSACQLTEPCAAPQVRAPPRPPACTTTCLTSRR
jgi:hypothetical protein